MSKNTNLSFLTDYITADITNGRIGINNASPAVAFDVVGATKITGVLTLTSTISNGTYAYTLPSATGTLALTSALSGTTGYHAKFTSSTAIGNGIIYDDGNQIGINVTPPTWYSNFKGLNLPNGSFIGYSTNASIFLSQNLYFNASGSWAYINTGTGGQYSIDGSGTHSFSTVVSGGANASATLVERIQISATGITTIRTNDNVILKATNVSQAMYIDYKTSANSRRAYMGFGGDSNSNFDIWNSENGAMVFGTNNTERFRISGANAGFGTSSPGAQLVLAQNNGNSSAQTYLTFRNLATNYGSWSIWKTDDNNLGFYYGVNSDTPSAGINMKLRYNGITEFTTKVLINTSTDNGENLYVGGTIRATGTITANSDINLKKNLLKIENALEKVEQINGYTYEFKEDDSKRHAGLIAQEVEIVLPEIVNAGADKIKGIEYGNISALLVEAIKELSTEINIIKKQINL